MIAAAFDRAAFGRASLRIGVHRELLLEIHAAVARKVLLFARVALHVEECLLGQATRVARVGLDELDVACAQRPQHVAFVILLREDLPVLLGAARRGPREVDALHLCRKVDIRRYGEYWKNRTRQLLEAVTRDRGIAPAEQSMDIRFHELVGHDMERVEDICQLAGNPLSDESRGAMIRYAKENPQGVNGRVIYRLEDFGLDGAALREEFRFYTDHFDLQLES